MKRLILLFVILFLTGCTASYNLEIGDSFKENINVLENSNTGYVFGNLDMRSYNNYYLTKELPYHYDDPYVPEINYRYDDVSYYDVKDLSSGSQIGISLSSNFEDAASFAKSNFIWKTCNVKRISLKGDVLKISVSGFKSFDEYKILDEVIVVINSKYKALDSNADKINGREYTWIINRDNYLDKTIDISFNTSSVLDSVKDEFSDPMVRFAAVIFGVVFVSFIFYLFVRKIFIKRNKI